jgi:flagellin-like hook-associated protein FlgL
LAVIHVERVCGAEERAGCPYRNLGTVSPGGDTQKLQLRTHISSLQDADLTEAIMELGQAQLQQTAALQARAKTPTQTLFDFLG